MAGAWALGTRPWGALFQPLPPPAFAAPFTPSSTGNPLARRPKVWTPLSRALDRFDRHIDRFACERQVRALAPALERLRFVLRAGGAGLEELLSRGFQGSSLGPQNEAVLRQDASFKVTRWIWEPEGHRAPTKAAEFCADLRHLLLAHALLTLADLECVGISDLTAEPRTASAEPDRLRTQIRFELGGPVAAAAREPRAPFWRWQATGEWAIEWEHASVTDSAAGSLASVPGVGQWLITKWNPVEGIETLGPDRVFTDATASAFGQDPTYQTHLLRDTNYWRTVLDTASGIDIFGNYGVSVGDADGDGQDEIYLCQPQGLPNRLYHQHSPGVFEDVAAGAGVDLLDSTPMALFADILNRGRQDLILITESSPLLFLNDGRGRFKLARHAFPAAGEAALTGAALADYNRDGYLDLYVCAYGYFQGQGAAPIPAPYYDARNGPPNHLYRNRGDGTFEDVTERSGLNHGNDRFSFACGWIDIDDDGWPDLCVVNDFGRDNLYHNRADGTFEEIADGIAAHGAGMSVSIADLAGRGEPDLYVANMSSAPGSRITSDPEFPSRFASPAAAAIHQFAAGNALYRRAPGPAAELPYQQVPDAAGASWGRWAWCSDSFDLENDGRLDLYVVNGFLSAPDSSSGAGTEPLDAYLWQDIIALSPQSGSAGSEYRTAWAAGFELAHQDHSWDGFQRNVFFLNLGDGAFADASAATGLDFRDDGRAFAVFDYDGDGDADLVIHSRTGPQLRLLRNDLASGNRSLAVRLTAVHGNRDAIGARVEIETPSGRVVRWLGAGSGFLAQHSKELVFGLGPHAAGLTAHVRWPGGGKNVYPSLDAGFRYHFVEGEAAPARERLRQRPLGVTDGEATRRIASNRLDKEASEAGSSNHLAASEPPPGRFSTWLINPLPLPPLAGFSIPARRRSSSGAERGRALVWLWDAGSPASTGASFTATAGLEAFLKVQKQLFAQLIVWGGEAPPALATELAIPLVKADDRLRLFCTTALTYLFDRRRAPSLPTGLLIEESEGSFQGAAAPGSQNLVKIYWGGAEPSEILKDWASGGPTGAAALPFSGQAHLCSFTRDTRVLGAALASAGLYAESEPYLARAVAANPNDADAAYNLALAARELGKPELALSSVRTALAARPHFPEADDLFGVLLMQSGKLREAEAHLEKATQAAPDFAPGWNNLGYLRLSEGELASSRLAVEKALAIEPDFPEALNNLGIIAARQGSAAEARGIFRKAMALAPDNEQAAINLGVLEAKLGNTKGAIEAFKSVLEHNPEAAAVLLNLARLEIASGQPADGRKLLTGWLIRHPDDTIAKELLEKAASSAR